MVLTKYEFPKTLEGRMDAILSTINTEWKSLTWNLMDRTLVTTTDLQKRYEQNTGALVAPSTFGAYNEATLIPIGLVSKWNLRQHGKMYVTNYQLNDYGAFYRPIANFAIKNAVENKTSMYEILGVTRTSGKYRSPFLTYKILKELHKSDEMREVDIERPLGMARTSFSKYAKRLSKLGLISYESISSDDVKGKFVYSWVSGKNPDDVKTLQDGHGYSLDTMIKAAKYMMEVGECSQYNLSDNMSVSEQTAYQIFRQIANQGFIQPKKFKGNVQRSKAKITDFGKRFFENFFIPLEESLDPKNRRISDIILDSAEKVGFEHRRYAHKLYEPFSGRRNKTRNERKNQIVEILLKCGQLKTGELENKLGVSPKSYLHDMLLDGEVEKYRNGLSLIWKIAAK